MRIHTRPAGNSPTRWILFVLIVVLAAAPPSRATPVGVADEDVLWAPIFHGPGVTSGRFHHASVSALVAAEGALVVAGSFSTAGPILTRNIARWDGEHWGAFSPRLEGSFSVWGDGNVACLAI